MIKILAACGAGVNSSHQIKSALEEELSNRGFDVHCDAVMVKTLMKTLSKVVTFLHQLLQQILVLTQVFQLSKLDQSYSVSQQ